MENKNAPNSFSLLLDKYFSVIMVLVILFIILVGVQFFLRPLYSETQSQQQAEIAAGESELTTRRAFLQRLQSSVQLYRSIKLEELARVFEMVPTSANESELYADMETMLAENGFQLKSMSIGEGGEETVPNAGTGVKSLSVHLSVSGDPSYEGFKALLQSIEQHLRILDLSSVSYLPNQAEYVLNLKTYYQD